MKKLVVAGLALAALTLSACGSHPTVTNPDGWIVPDVANVTRCVNDGDVTLCTDQVTGQRYLNGVPVNN